MLDNKKIRVGSAKAYLSSLSKFCEFIVDHYENEVWGFPKVPSQIIKKAQAVAKRFKGMISAVTKEYGHTKWDRQMEEEDRAVPVSVIENMMETEAAKEAHRYLTHAANRPPTEKMFLSIRDYLIACLEVENCQRPGPMESATLTEPSHAKTLDGKYVMKVSCNKTSNAGPAPITMRDNTMSNLKAYVKYVRPHYAKKDVEEIFIT